MHLKLIILMALISSVALANSRPKILNNYDPATDVIAENYEAGSFLIYDCKEKHWVCVLEYYYKNCTNLREEDQLLKKLELSCAPIAQFPNKKSCFQQQLFLTGQNIGTNFCIGDEWKQKEIRF
jgi:hypothetical protein